MKTNKFKLVAIFALLGFLVTSCSSSSSDPIIQDNSISGLASRDPDLSLLVKALTKANLVLTLKTGSYTVFAPTNQAFIDAGYTSDAIDALPSSSISALQQLLLNHVINGAVQSSSLVDNSYIKTLGLGSASTTNTLSMYVSKTSTVKLNGTATVTTADILASNGVIHKVDKVITLPTIITHATANPNFSSLVGALTSAGQPDFVTILSGAGPFTVFAPTNAAFTDLNTELAPGGIASVSSANLTKVLEYHVVSPANVLSTDLTNNEVVTPILTPAQTFTVQLPTSGPQVLDASNRTSKIIITDVQCSNGVIHAVDKVFLPVL